MEKIQNIEQRFSLLNIEKDDHSHPYPLIFILGPTSIGKTKISLHLAKSLKAEIINSDAFSLYKQADILTAKASKSEQRLIKHHMIDILELNELNYNVTNYKIDCVKIIDNLKNDKIIPIIVGGTNYYLESVLFNRKSINKINQEKLEDLHKKTKFKNDFSNANMFLTLNNHNTSENFKTNLIHQLEINLKEIEYSHITGQTSLIQSETRNEIEKILQMRRIFLLQQNKNDKNDNNDSRMDLFNESLTDYVDHMNPNITYDILFHIDPTYYRFLHRNNIRRIKNGVIYFFTENKQKSEELSEELIRLNYPESLIIFLHPKSFDDLKSRIEKRIDAMLDEKGLREIFYILDYFLKDVEISDINFENLESEIKFDEGLIQAIGYKEFFSFYIMIRRNKEIYEIIKKNILNENFKLTDLIDKNNINDNTIINNGNNFDLFLEEYLKSKAKLISNTMKYAKSQLKFIKKRIIPFFQNEPNKIKEIEISEFNEEKFQEYIRQAEDFVKSHMKNFKEKDMGSNIILKNEGTIKINKIAVWNNYYCDVCNSKLNGDEEFNAHMKSNKHKKKKLKLKKINKEKSKLHL